MSGETSLARQLKKLAVPQTSLLLQDKIRPSLLFDPREASSIDKDTIFAIGSSGLDELQVIEPKFVKFEKTIFSENSKSLERAVQDAKVNKELNENITEFLRMLSPYFLLRPAHKALEWLIYRFHIHLFNVDILLACILPYHETRIFVRVIQLLDLANSANRWHWLKPLQKPGIPLPKPTLLNHCHADSSFMKFVCDLVPDTMKVYNKENASVFRTIISFYTSTVLGALEVADKITDSMVSFLLPYIIKGIKSDVDDYCSASYMIICQLIRKVKVYPMVLKELLNNITEHIMPSLLNEGLQTVLLIFQLQDIKVLPKKAFLSMCSTSDVVKSFAELSVEYRVTPFLMPFFKKAVPAIFNQVLSKESFKENEVKIIVNLLKSLFMERAEVIVLLRLILKRYIKLYKDCKTDKKSRKVLKRKGGLLLKQLAKRWPDHFDHAVESFFQKKLKSSKVANNLINNSLADFKHEVLPDSGTSLFLGINHPNNAVRANAVNIFLSRILQNKDLDAEFVESSLLHRLNDEQPDIVQQILSVSQVLKEKLPEDKLFSSLCCILRKKTEKDFNHWYPVKLKALELLCNLQNPATENSLQLDILVEISPFLFPRKNEAVKGLLCVLNSSLGDINPLISAIKKDCSMLISTRSSNSQELTDLMYGVITSLQNAFQSLDEDSKILMVSCMMQKIEDSSSECHTILMLLLILQQVIMESNTEQKLKWASDGIKLCSKLIQSNQLFYHEEEVDMSLKSIIPVCLKSLKKSKCPFAAVGFYLQSLVQFTAKKNFTSEIHWWPQVQNQTENSQYYQLLVELFCLLTEQSNITHKNTSLVYRSLLALMFKHHLPAIKDQTWFLSSLWCVYPFQSKSSVVMQLRALYIAITLCTKTQEQLEWFFDSSSVEFPSLFIPMASQNEQIRSAALHLLHLLLEHCEKCLHPYKKLGDKIYEFAEEIQLDPSQIFQIISSWLSPAYESREELAARTRQSLKLASETPESLALNHLLKLITDSATPNHIRHNLLLILDSADSEKLLHELIPVLRIYLKEFEDITKEPKPLDIAVIQLLLKKFTPVSSALLIDKNNDIIEALEIALQLTVTRGNVVDLNVHQMALQQVTKEFFTAIPSSAVQQKILGILVDLYLSSGSSDMGVNIVKTLRKLCVHASLLLKELHNFEFTTPKQTVREMKRSRVEKLSAPSTTDLLEKKAWRKITVILEIIQNKKKINKKELLVPVLFDILKRTLEWENQPSVEYVRQLILSSLSNCCDQLGVSGLDERNFQVELIVQCIRVSSDPKTHHQALLLLNSAATIFPDHVLHNIMSIFTFMGSNIVRQDDLYSFQVISQTVQTIVPALLQASHQQKEGEAVQVIAAVTRVFVDSLLDIPRHRQLPLFLTLITTLGPLDYLWLPLAQISDSFLSKSTHPAFSIDVFKDAENLPALLEFSLNLCEQFPPYVQLNACHNLINFLASLPDYKDKDQTSSTKVSQPSSDKELHFLNNKEPFNIASHTDKQLRHYKYNLLSVMNLLLSSNSFISQVSELDGKAHHKLEHKYQQVLESTLNYLQHVSHMVQADISKPTVKFWKAMLHKLYSFLDKINALLPSDQFIIVIKRLIKNPISLVRRKAMEMLNAKLLHQQTFFSQDNYETLLKLLKPLLRIAHKAAIPSDNTEVEATTADNLVLNRQTALYSLKLLSKIIGPTYPDKFKKVFNAVVVILTTDTSHYPLTSGALLCIAELCSVLQANILPYLSSFMPFVIQLLENSHDVQSLNKELLLLSIVTALQKLIENLAVFLSSYMEPILTQVSILAATHLDRGDNKSPLQQRLKAVCSHLASEVSPRVLIPAVENSYMKVLEKNKNALRILMTILSDRISTLEKDDLNSHLHQLQSFYMVVLDFRTQNPKETLSDVETVEGHVISSLMTLVLKLSEASFRPFFFRLYEWATRLEEHKSRVLTFYRLTHILAEKLKSLFVMFAGYFIKHAASTLDLNNIYKTEELYYGSDEKSTKQSSLLLNYMLDTLSSCFFHGGEDFVDKDCFITFMQPLVDQIENQHGGDEVFQTRVESHLVTCIGQFAAAASDNASWKSLNYQILLKTRHSSPKVRFAALQVLREVVKKLGNDYLVLLPESIPFLAELMEDENFEVEQYCQSVIADMEEVLGESLAKYF